MRRYPPILRFTPISESKLQERDHTPPGGGWRRGIPSPNLGVTRRVKVE